MRESWQGGLRLKVRPAVQHSASSGFTAPCRCSGISLLSWPWGSAALQTISALQAQRVCGSGDAFHPPWSLLRRDHTASLSHVSSLVLLPQICRSVLRLH